MTAASRLCQSCISSLATSCQTSYHPHTSASSCAICIPAGTVCTHSSCDWKVHGQVLMGCKWNRSCQLGVGTAYTRASRLSEIGITIISPHTHCKSPLVWRNSHPDKLWTRAMGYEAFPFLGYWYKHDCTLIVIEIYHLFSSFCEIILEVPVHWLVDRGVHVTCTADTLVSNVHR